MGQCLVECQWLILDLGQENFSDILRLAETLECVLWIEEVRTFIDGYQIVSLFISAEAEEFIKLFRKAVEHLAKLSHCRASKQALSNLTRLHSQTNRGFIQWRDVFYFLETAGMHNRRVRRGLHLWITGSWVIAPTEQAGLEKVVQLAQDNEISIFYQTKRLIRPEVQFYFKLMPSGDFNLRMNVLKKSMNLRHWAIVFEAEFYDAFETHPRLMLSTIPAFLKVITS
jgi:hypothetical protein